MNVYILHAFTIAHWNAVILENIVPRPRHISFRFKGSDSRTKYKQYYTNINKGPISYNNNGIKCDITSIFFVL